MTSWVPDDFAGHRHHLVDRVDPWKRAGHRLGLRTLAAILLAILLAACSGDSRPNPKDTVMALFGAMRDSDSSAVRSLVNLESAFESVINELPAPADADLLNDRAARLLGEMTGEGSLRRRWLEDNQIVIGRTELAGDTAYVEVSFLDRVTRVQYYNKMQLIFQGDRWMITRFRTM